MAPGSRASPAIGTSIARIRASAERTEDADLASLSGRRGRGPRSRARAARHGAGHRPLDGGDVPHVRAAQARRLARRRPRRAPGLRHGMAARPAADRKGAHAAWGPVPPLPLDRRPLLLDSRRPVAERRVAMTRCGLVRWLGRHDPGYMALRRAGRAAILLPALFALGEKLIDNAQFATFAAFGTFAMLALVDFDGRMRDRLQAQAWLGIAGAVLVCLGTLASRNDWVAAAGMSVVAFVVLFSGVVSSVLARATTSLLLA